MAHTLRSPRSARPLPPAGFSLVELLVALSIGAVIVTAMASGAQLFGTEIAYVRAASDTRLEEALLLTTDAIGDGWLVTTPEPERLEVLDPYGNVTAFYEEGNALKVRRPSGATGVLLEGLADLQLSTRTARRLREAAPVDHAGPWYSQAAPVGPSTEIVLGDGDAMALGFMMSCEAPEAVCTVDGVQEERLHASMDGLQLVFSFFDGSLKEFCHMHASPPHNPDHPGYAGGKVLIELYESRAPGDARPYGSPLATIEVPKADLPATEFYWWDTDSNQVAWPPDSILTPYEGPPDCGHDNGNGNGYCNHNNPHKNPVDAPNGVAWGWWENHPEVVLVILPTTVAFDIDLTGLGSIVEPGRAYSLVLSVFGWDELRLKVGALMSAEDSGLALRYGAAADFVGQPLGVGLDFSGVQNCTQTTAHDVVNSVSVQFQMLDGRVLSGSAAVAGQAAATDPWLGVIPGQLETMEL